MGLRIGLIAIIGSLLIACTSDSIASPTRSTGAALALPTATDLPPAQAQQSIAAACINDARFVEDLTIPDGQQVEPGDVLDKRWSVLNVGSCDWGAGYHLIRIDDGPIGARPELALYPARAGEAGVWSVQITAPNQTGNQLASWQAQAPDGTLFGDPVFVLIEVGS